MLLPVKSFEKAYKHIKLHAINTRSKVLVCVTGDCDAISACHIFTGLLRGDNITFSMHPVNGYSDIKDLVDKLDTDCSCLVLINCGSSEPLYDYLDLDTESREHLKVLVVDSHRPHNLLNLYIDGIDADLSEARVLSLSDDGEFEEGEIPSLEQFHEFINLEDEEDDEDEDEDDDLRSPGQRRRVDEDGEAEDAEVARQVQKEKKARRRECIEVIDKYYQGHYRGRSVAISMFLLATQLHKDTNEMLWWAIIGLTEQYVNDAIDKEKYNAEVEGMQAEVRRHNTPESEIGLESGNMSKAHISFERDFRFMLLQHWTLHDSMFYSNYVASKLGLWRDRSNSNRLQHLLARMGFKLTEANQKYANMKGELKARLPEALGQFASEFGLTDVVFGTFKKQRSFGSTISAADCVHIASAMLHTTAGGEDRWADSFFEAYDALQMCACREDEWDKMLLGKKTPAHMAVELQKEVVDKGFELVLDKGRIHGFPKFRYSHITVGDSNSWMNRPLAISKMVHLLMQIDMDKNQRDAKPMVMGVENEATQMCTVVGVVGTNRTGYKDKNKFGGAFQKTAEMMPSMTMIAKGFDVDVISIKNSDFHEFVDKLQEALDEYL